MRGPVPNGAYIARLRRWWVNSRATECSIQAGFPRKITVRRTAAANSVGGTHRNQPVGGNHRCAHNDIQPRQGVGGIRLKRRFCGADARDIVLAGMRNVLITGTPRSGTTLLCSLLNKLPDTVALHEPMNVWDFPNCPDASAVADVIDRFCADTRKSLLGTGVAVSKHVGGLIPDNVAADQVNRSGTRLRHTEHGPVRIDKPLSERFALAIKHPVAFTALLGTLSARFDCLAIVRNPLSMLASWNSLAWLNVKNGHAPIGEKLDPELRQTLADEPDVFERQIQIVEWFYNRFRKFLPDAAVLKYEDVIASHGQNLQTFFPHAAQLNENLVSKNINKFYDKALMQQLGERLLKRGGVIWEFYSKADVEKLLQQVDPTARQTPLPS